MLGSVPPPKKKKNPPKQKKGWSGYHKHRFLFFLNFIWRYSYNWNQMSPTVSADPHTNSVETSKVPSSPQTVVPVLFSTFHASVESLSKQWLRTRAWHHKLTSLSDELCGQRWPLCQATLHHKTGNILRLRKDFAEKKVWIFEERELEYKNLRRQVNNSQNNMK